MYLTSLLRLGVLVGLLPLLLGAGRIEGVVFDRTTGLPQAGLELRVDDLVAVTDETGAFSFELEIASLLPSPVGSTSTRSKDPTPSITFDIFL